VHGGYVCRLVGHAYHVLAAEFRLRIRRERSTRVDCADLTAPKGLVS
jgi:hypothetical protein